MNQKVTPGAIVILVAGAVALLASFLPFFEAHFTVPGQVGLPVGETDDSWTAWSRSFPTLFPLATLIVVGVVVSAVLVAVTRFTDARIERVLGIGLAQVLTALGFLATVVALTYLVQDFGDLAATGSEGDAIDKGIGYYLLLLSAIASLVGGILLISERKNTETGAA